MQRDTETTMLGQPVAFSDGLGDRVVLEDEATRDTSEKLYLRPLFKPQQRAVQERAARLINFTHIRFARVRGLDTEGDQLVLASDYVAGTRLSTVLEISADHQLRIDIDTALHLTRELLSALAVLHDSRNVTHGVLSPERLVLTPKWRLVVVDYTLGLAIERLKLSRSRLWNDLRVPMPPAAGVVRFDRRADVAQVGMVALALVLGRSIRRDEYPNRIRQLLDEVVEWRRATRATPLGAELRGWFERALPIESRRPFTTIRDAQKGLEDVVTQSAEYRPALGSLKEFLKRYDELMVRMAPAVGTAPDADAAKEPEVAAAGEAPAEPAEDPSPEPMPLTVATAEEAGRAEAPSPAPDGEAAEADTGASATASRSARHSERPKAKGGAKSSAGREKTRKPRKSAARAAEPLVDPPSPDDADDEIAWIEAELARLAGEGALQVADTVAPAGGVSESAGALPELEADASVVEPAADLAAPEQQPTVSSDAETTADLTASADSSLDEILEITALADAARGIDIAPARAVGNAGADPSEELFAAQPTTSEPAARAEEIRLDREPVTLQAHEESPGAGESLVQLSPGSGALGVDADRSLDVWELDIAAIAPVADASVQPDLPAPTPPDVPTVAHVEDAGEVARAQTLEPDAPGPGSLVIHEASGSATSGGASTPARDDAADDLSASEAVREVETVAATPAPVEMAVPLDAAAEQHTASIGAAPEWTLTNPTPDTRPAAEAVDEATGPAVEADVLQSPLADELTAPLPFDQEPLEAAAILSAHAETVEEILGALAEPEDTLASHESAELDSETDGSGEPMEGAASRPWAADEVTSDAGVRVADSESIESSRAEVQAALSESLDAIEADRDASRTDAVETAETAGRDTESTGDHAGSAVSGWLDNISWLRGRRNETADEAAGGEEGAAFAEADVNRQLDTATAQRVEHAASDAAPTSLFEGGEGPAADAAVALNSDLQAAPAGTDATGDVAAPVRTSLWDRVRAIGRRGGRRPDADDEIVFPRADGSVSIRPESVAADIPPPTAPEVEQTHAALTTITEPRAIPVPARADPATTGADGPSAADAVMAPDASAEVSDLASGAEVGVAGQTATVSTATPQAASTESEASLQAPSASPDPADRHRASEAPPEPVSSAPVDDARTVVPAPSPLGYVDALAVAPPPIPVSVDAPESGVSPEPDDEREAREVTVGIDSRAAAGLVEPAAPEAVAAIEPPSAPAEVPPAAAGDSRDTRPSEQSGPARKDRRKGRSGKPRKGKGRPAGPIPSPIAVTPAPPAMVDEPARSVAPAPAGPAAPEIAPTPLAASEARLPPWLRGRSIPDTPPTPADAAGEPPAVALSAVSTPAPVDLAGSLPPPMPQSVAPSAESQREWAARSAGEGPRARADIAAAPLGLRDDQSVVWHQGVGSPAEVSRTERRALGTSRWRALNWRRIAAASIVLILLEGASLAAVYWMMTPTQLGTLAVQTNPTGIEVLVDGRPHGVTPILEELPPGRYVLELRGLKARKVVPVEISAGVHTAQFIAWPREVLTGGVRIVSVPDGAEVTIDGTAYGPAPVEVTDLTAGRHQVVLSGSGGSVSTTVHVLADRVTEFEVAIYSGWIAVFSPVKLDLFEQGRPIGTSEDGRILAAPGLHEIEVVSERLGYRAVFRVNVVPGEVTPLSIEPPPGRLIVDGAEGSEVWVDGRLAGVTPLAEIDVPLGTRRIELRHPDGRVDRFTETATLAESIRITPRQLVGRNGAGPSP